MLWVKTFHVLSVMAWLAGIFYLPRIFVHYSEGFAAGEDVRRLIVMANNLLRFMTVMALIAISLGVWLWLGYGISGTWLHIKLMFVFALVVYHGVCWHYVKRIGNSSFSMSSRFLRYFNEVSLLAVVPILVLVVVKPL